MPVPKRNLNRVGICAWPEDAGGVLIPVPSYDALAAKSTAGIPDGAVVLVIADGVWLAEFWQLRAVETPPAADPDNGVVPSADPARAWFRAS